MEWASASRRTEAAAGEIEAETEFEDGVAKCDCHQAMASSGQCRWRPPILAGFFGTRGVRQVLRVVE